MDWSKTREELELGGEAGLIFEEDNEIWWAGEGVSLGSSEIVCFTIDSLVKVNVHIENSTVVT
ncbi:MAG: hypothetical protein ACFFCZ_16350 [Promethearchaeota archaeon]